MDYKMLYAIIELTMKCNMRCMHCGSACKEALEDELTTEEMLNLCDDLANMGLKCVTLSGGEPTTRNDWHKIAKRCVKNNIYTNMITNGWELDYWYRMITYNNKFVDISGSILAGDNVNLSVNHDHE